MGVGDGSIVTLSHIFNLMPQKRKCKRVSSSADCVAVGAAAAAGSGAIGSDGLAATSVAAAAAVGEVGLREPVELAPGGSLVVPLWVHAAEAGQLDFSCVWFCEAAVSGELQASHYIRLEFNMSVQLLCMG
jgi:hypothetical protein